MELLHAMHLVLQSPIAKGFMSGAGAAALIDFNAFRTWNTWHDLQVYNWGVASFRWLQGGVVGAVTAVGAGYL